ncbi:hypothetical protein [Acetobacter senegalensis]|uniref:hypothetical protein n=1 Tax=Acetobacter senegalensis TaxID=446692 RepID=UPI001EDAEF86|nr:hypothetical protein [Acetobacter senegalensis]MCG4258168.1 hypothetical protein [Acetobacter senegalensis]MCG4268095.1 hypothetical protein [Acetobacter senegalensis]
MIAENKAPRKWMCGEIIPNDEAGLVEIATFRGWFYHSGLNKPIHSIVICNMSLSTIISQLRLGRIHRAKLNPDWVEFEREKFLALPEDARMAITGDADFAEVEVPA